MLLDARVWLLLSRWSCSYIGQRKRNVSHDNPLVDPEFVIREEDWVNHKVDEENFDPKLVAVAKQCGIAKVREAEGP